MRRCHDSSSNFTDHQSVWQCHIFSTWSDRLELGNLLTFLLHLEPVSFLNSLQEGPPLNPCLHLQQRERHTASYYKYFLLPKEALGGKFS